MYLDEVRKEERYSVYDVFGRNKICYENSMARIWGWETPVSIIYREEEMIKLRFKKTLEPYAEGFEAVPFEECPEKELCISAEHDDKKQTEKRFLFALENYKKSREGFECKPLTPKALEHFLKSGFELYEEEYLLSDDGSSPLYDAYCYWFAVDVDCILCSFHTGLSIDRQRAVLSFWNDNCCFGDVGYDGKFYKIEFFFEEGRKHQIYDVKDGLKEVSLPEWLQNYKASFGCRFLRGYIVTAANDCYDYEGNYLENASLHHKNVRFLNDMIKFLRKKEVETLDFKVPHLEMTLPAELLRIDVEDIEHLLVPHLESKNALSRGALNRFLQVKAIIKKAGVQEDFIQVVRNILCLNCVADCGGSSRGLCSDKLLANLNKLLKSAGAHKTKALLLDYEALKAEVIRINNKSKK